MKITQHFKRRRTVLTALAVGVAFLSGNFRRAHHATASPVTDKTRWGMLIDAAKCTDCNACVTACNTEHGIQPADPPTVTDAQWIRKLTVTDDDGAGNSDGAITELPMLCQHCEDPPCVSVCPTGASFRRADGIVLVDKHTCIGCRYCVLACPYQARVFVHENLRGQKSWSPRGKGTVESCTLCVHRVDESRTPACVEACAQHGNGAMVFGDINDRHSEIAARLSTEPSQQVRADLNLNTGVRYQNL